MKKLTLLVWLLMVATAFADGTSGGGGGGGGGGAPTDSTYFVKSSEGGLSAENVVQTNGTGVSVTYNTVPDPDTVTFALDTTANITWSGTLATTNSFSTSSYLNFTGIAAPAVSAAGSARIFADTSGILQCSENGATYQECLSAGGAGDPTLAGDVDGLGSANDLDEANVETELEAVLDLNQLQGQIATNQIADGAISGGLGGEITDATITESDLAANSVDTTEIDDDAVTGQKINLTGSDVSGDLARFNGTIWTRVGIGTAGDVLTVSGGQPAWVPNACTASAPLDATYMVASSNATLEEEQVITDGDGIAWTTGTVSDPDTITANTIVDGSTITNDAGAGGNELAIIEAGVETLLDLQDLAGAVTDAQVPNTITVTLAATATALAADGTDCTAGQYARGVDASGNAELCTAAGGAADDPTYVQTHFEDFMMISTTGTVAGDDAGFQISNSGTGAAVGNSTTVLTNDRPGQIAVRGGTTASGTASLRRGTLHHLIGGGASSMEFEVQLAQLSIVTEEFNLKVGMLNANQAAVSDGIYWKYDRLTNTDWLACVVEDGSGETCVDTDVPVAEDVWINLRIDVNAAGTSVDFYIDDVNELTTTNAEIPDTTADFLGQGGVELAKTASAGAVSDVYVDYYKWSQTLTVQTR